VATEDDILPCFAQIWYVECQTPHGKSIDPGQAGSELGDLPLFFGNLTNAYGRMLLAYVDKAFAMGFDGLCASSEHGRLARLNFDTFLYIFYR
jgi:hypothetical protein